MRNNISVTGRVSAIALATLLLAPTATFAQSAPGADGETPDIVVTATKRDESTRDIPGAVSAVSEQDLQRLNAQSLSDYVTRVPGVVFNDYQPGVSEVVIRGVASTTYHEANQATTGYYINQIPLVEPGFPLVIPDIDSFDVKQVEVLRGPQGTLFGSSSLGGAINYVVNEADPSAIDVGAEGIVSSTRRSGEASYAAKAMINVPIIADKLAVRLVGLQRYDAGYLTNVGTGEKGSNDLRVRGLRGSIVFTPTETTKISALGLYQEYDLDDQTYVQFGADPHAKTYDRNTNVDEYQDTEIQLYSLRLDQDLGFANLTAVGSHTIKKADLAFDDSIFGGNDPRTNTPQLSSSVGKSTTDYGELRLASSGTGPFTWLIGGNYTKLRSDSTDGAFIEGIGAYIDANPALFGGQAGSVLAPDDLARRTVSTSRVREIAAFGELAYTFADVLTLTLGGRYFEYTSRPRLQYLPNAALIAPFDYQPGARKESGFVPKVSLSYKPSNRLTLYGLYSEGFRIGGINTYAVATGVPIEFNSDSTQNYEVGAKFDLVPGTMSFDIAAFHIKWNDIQSRLFTPVDFNAYTVNGGGAKIDGIEMSMVFRPSRNLTYTANLTYNDARLSALLPDSFAPGGGYAAGTRLPGASEWILANQLDFELRDSPLRPRIGIAHRYLSKAPVAFGATLQKGDYSLIDLNAAITVSEGIEAGVFAKNLFDQYGILNAPFSFAGSVTRPRTIGASLRFGLR
ncbi:TonB-dependent receptor [Sphingomonas hylomeconis]|uniref:TonB-dependent receptor n=1 Tax=Sphingomonas hylomeconis TaxID=1395958 RepID=A0ABV7SXS2_9SPHN|nr:TonB-dependent receptor [Sphingomonas hylomeconis]